MASAGRGKAGAVDEARRSSGWRAFRLLSGAVRILALEASEGAWEASPSGWVPGFGEGGRSPSFSDGGLLAFRGTLWWSGCGLGRTVLV